MNSEILVQQSNRATVVRRGRHLEYFTIGYNSLEGLIAVGAGLDQTVKAESNQRNAAGY